MKKNKFLVSFIGDSSKESLEQQEERIYKALVKRFGASNISYPERRWSTVNFPSLSECNGIIEFREECNSIIDIIKGIKDELNLKSFSIIFPLYHDLVNYYSDYSKTFRVRDSFSCFDFAIDNSCIKEGLF